MEEEKFPRIKVFTIIFLLFFIISKMRRFLEGGKTLIFCVDIRSCVDGEPNSWMREAGGVVFLLLGSAFITYWFWRGYKEKIDKK